MKPLPLLPEQAAKLPMVKYVGGNASKLDAARMAAELEPEDQRLRGNVAVIQSILNKAGEKKEEKAQKRFDHL